MREPLSFSSGNLPALLRDAGYFTPPPKAPLRQKVRFRSYLLVYAVIAVFLTLAHGPLLHFPYFWDEAGQFVPAALDIYHHGWWVPHSTIPNVHPPGLMAWLAGWWHIFGLSVAATRFAMLLLAAFGALNVFLLAIELSRGFPGTPGFGALAMTCLSPLFFAQSMLAQLDMPAMCLTMLALLFFVQNRFRDSAIVCAALVLVKETGVVAPMVFGLWLLVERRWRDALWFLLPLPGLACWLFALHHATGHWLGNEEFGRYNVWYNLNPARLAFALLRRVYYLFIGTGHIIGTIALLYAFGRTPIFKDRAWRISATLLAVHVVVVTVLGGAVLERYLLPVLPIVYIAFSIATRALAERARRIALIALIASLLAANLLNPPYPFPLENNMAFASFVELEMEAANSLRQYPGTVVTAFPLANSLRNPDLGLVDDAREVRDIPDFSRKTIESLDSDRPELMIVFDTTWDPLGILHMPLVRQWFRKSYQYEPQLTGEEIGEMLNMRVARSWHRRGFGMQLLVHGRPLRLPR